jgi:hypothetical protein
MGVCLGPAEEPEQHSVHGRWRSGLAKSRVAAGLHTVGLHTLGLDCRLHLRLPPLLVALCCPARSLTTPSRHPACLPAALLQPPACAETSAAI